VRIEDYALIGDLQTSALVGRNGSVDWLCLPRFDSASCFTALLGEEKHGRWLIAPAGEVRSVSRRYREGTLVLETDFETADGAARVIDFMRDGLNDLAGPVDGRNGRFNRKGAARAAGKQNARRYKRQNNDLADADRHFEFSPWSDKRRG